MAALWSATILRKSDSAYLDGFVFSSADAKSMKRADLRASTVKARDKAKARFLKKHPTMKACDVVVTGVQCVG